MMAPDMLLIEDEKVVLAREIKKLKDEMDSLKQTYLRLDVIHKTKKQRYEEIDKRRALTDGRLRVVKTITKKETKQEPMTQEQINKLLDELNDLIK
jgi:hypothetical protein